MTESMLSPFRIAGFPGRYVQGPGALEAVPGIILQLGASHVLLLTDDVVEQVVGLRLRNLLRESSLTVSRLHFGGACTRAAIEALAGEGQRCGGDLLLALGGGKTIDTAKGISRSIGARLIVAPTVASNDSATSRLIVLYDESGQLVGVDLMARNPDAVVVDTTEIARAPVRYFRAGIGDALSKTFEAAQCRQSGGLNFHGGRPPRVAGFLGDYCYQVLREAGPSALAAVQSGTVTEAVEDVVEATVLLSGLAFENGGLSVAHGLLRGLSAVPGLSQALHGEMVAFGTLVQLIMEQRSPAWMEAHLRLVRALDLPVSLEALGKGELTAEELDTVVTRTLAAPYITNFERPIDAAMLKKAILDADKLGRSV